MGATRTRCSRRAVPTRPPPARQRALSANPSHAYNLFNFAQFLTERRRADEAEEAAARAAARGEHALLGVKLDLAQREMARELAQLGTPLCSSTVP